MVDTVSVVCSILGGFILLFGLCSLVIKERLYLSEASIAILCGIIFGPVCAKFVDISTWGNEDTISHEFSRVVIAIQVMAAGVALPKAYLRKELRSILILLGPVMTYMWLVSGLLVWAMIPGLNFLESLMISACFTPTDPVLANSIVQGKFAEKHVPTHVRHIISCESGANDGLGYPFLFLAIYLLEMDVGPAIGKWAYWIMAYNVLLAIVIGFIAGFIARKLLKYAVERKFIDKESFLVFAVALALFLMGVIGLMGSDDLFACFIAGNSFTWNDWFRVETEKAHLSEVIDLLLNLSIFVYIGATMPWALFSQPAVWRLIVLAILVLFLRRLPIVVALYKFIPAIHNWREAVFTGWFGPIGVGAIFYLTVALESIPDSSPHVYARDLLKPIIYFMVLASVVVHGITIPLFYVGTFATRTLTRTSDMGSHVIRIPKSEMANIQDSHRPAFNLVDEADLSDFDIAVCNKKDEGCEDGATTEHNQPKRHTAITILTPDDPVLDSSHKHLHSLDTTHQAASQLCHRRMSSSKSTTLSESNTTDNDTESTYLPNDEETR
ncbi:Sodium/hydrogen exchanger family-domain-containing protein [Mycotypha africana]|uniref:Sodium/hydrogen exchanger family-domain-containing protein n=1 Tax=Mycotypha africana TaxID=64632 RepID=UPI0023004DD5|nr:Sodium/hydrogen exchanger family-domain-containing protein [Mycotypha africana]KAI8979644.1 Sodium/hydrogen exchanger family-domain-containing protein [Mycotypha africana]